MPPAHLTFGGFGHKYAWKSFRTRTSRKICSRSSRPLPRIQLTPGLADHCAGRHRGPSLRAFDCLAALRRILGQGLHVIAPFSASWPNFFDTRNRPSQPQQSSSCLSQHHHGSPSQQRERHQRLCHSLFASCTHLVQEHTRTSGRQHLQTSKEGCNPVTDWCRPAR